MRLDRGAKRSPRHKEFAKRSVIATMNDYVAGQAAKREPATACGASGRWEKRRENGLECPKGTSSYTACTQGAASLTARRFFHQQGEPIGAQIAKKKERTLWVRPY